MSATRSAPEFRITLHCRATTQKTTAQVLLPTLSRTHCFHRLRRLGRALLLQRPHLREQAVRAQQFRMRAALDDPPFVHHDHVVAGMFYVWEKMRGEDQIDALVVRQIADDVATTSSM